RLLNAMETGDRLITGQVVDSVAPVAECIRATDALPLPSASPDDVLARPGGTGLTADRSHIRRGIGWGVSIKNLMYSEGFDDFSTARCRLEDGVASLKFATSEVGQGFTMLAQQIARSVLGVDDVVLETIDTGVGSAGSTSASRQNWMSGGAVHAACTAVLGDLLDHVATTTGWPREFLELEDVDIVDRSTGQRVSVREASLGQRFERTEEYHHPVTEDLDENGQGDCHVAFAFVAHRAVVDVDPDLGLVKVVQIATAQDVGRIHVDDGAVGHESEGHMAVALAILVEIFGDRMVIFLGAFEALTERGLADRDPLTRGTIDDVDILQFEEVAWPARGSCHVIQEIAENS
ncbi:MAG: molybdopterin cofactor-binding domain-containing protein, partial [Actinomycetota bacterium]